MEYLNPDFMIPLQQRWLNAQPKNYTAAKENLTIYAQALLRHRTRNGWLSVKLFPVQHRLFLQAFPGAHPPCYVYLKRRDKVAQTISIAVMLLTRRAFEEKTEFRFMQKIGEINQTTLHQIMRWIYKSETYWNGYLETVDPNKRMSLVWEDILANPAGLFQQISQRFGLPRPQAALELDATPYTWDDELKLELRSKYRASLESLNHELSEKSN
jgi:LPS sulfotransferase NodH